MCLMLRLGIHRVGGPEGTSDVRGRDPGGLELTSMSEDGWKLVCISGASHLVATASCHGGSPWWSSSWALHGGGAHARRACALEKQKELGSVRHTEVLHTNKVSQ